MTGVKSFVALLLAAAAVVTAVAIPHLITKFTRNAMHCTPDGVKEIALSPISCFKCVLG
jgi:hypothetical protein